MTDNIIQNGWQFLTELFNNISSGILFFGGPYDIFLTLLDIFITTVLIYFVLKLIRDSRAWQLLKGIALIVVFSQIFTLMGMQTIGFILTNTLSITVVALVVLFQPELRRALETVGRNSFTLLSGVVTQEIPLGKNALYSMIDSIVRAAEKMAETHTGALIIIERETKLGEIAEQDNAVIMDSAVSSTLLQQIFYKGSPLHDGAVLIRNGRINAARCHVPLSDNYHLRRDYGTRHRAAIGASEMGDAIAVVVSEERGVMSIAVDGRLYTMDNADALRTILHKQLDSEIQGGVISNLLKSTKMIKRSASDRSKNKSVRNEKAFNQESVDSHNYKKTQPAASDPNSTTTKMKKKRILMMLSSFLVAIFVWLYVQITVNPVETRIFTVPLTTTGEDQLAVNGYKIDSLANTIVVTLKGRSNNLKGLSESDIVAKVDVSEIKSSITQVMRVSIKIKRLVYFEISPVSVSVDFSAKGSAQTQQPTPSVTSASSASSAKAG